MGDEVKLNSRQLCAAVLVSSLAAIGPQRGLAQDAVAYQINVAHDGHTDFPGGFFPPLKRLWHRSLGAQVSYPLIANDLVFVTVGGQPGPPGSTFYALSLNTGKTVWQKPLDGPYNWSNAGYDSNRVFVINMAGTLQAITADTSGQLLWSVTLPPPQNLFETPPLAANGHIYTAACGSGCQFYSVNEQTGALEWERTQLASGFGSSPGIGEGGIFDSHIGNVLQLDPSTGKTIWGKQVNWTGAFGETPVDFAGRLYTRDPTNGNYVFDENTGLHKKPYLSNGTPAFWHSPNGKDFMITRRAYTLYETSVNTGRVVWKFNGDGKLFSSALVINDVVVSPSYSGEIYLLDAATGKELWSKNVGAPILASDSDNLTPFPFTGLGAGGGVLIVPASNELVAYSMKN